MTAPDPDLDASPAMPGTDADWADAFTSATSNALAEVGFLTGVNYSTGQLLTGGASYWSATGRTAHKWGSSALGTGASTTFYFDPASNFSATEKTTVKQAFALWAAAANVTFTEVTNSSQFASASLKMTRGGFGSGAFESDGGLTTGSGSTLGTHTAQSTISIETSAFGFDLSGSWTTAGGYGISTIIHEIGHFLGLGHGGNYNGTVNPATQQFGPYDELVWTTMSYIDWSDDPNAKFKSSYELAGTRWVGEGVTHFSPGTWMPLDLLAVQELYGAPTSTPLSGGQVFGFHTNIGGLLQTYFDFTINTNPVVTLYDTGVNNTLDLSAYTTAETINLMPGSFSSFAGMTNNLAIAYGTRIDTAIGGSSADLLISNSNANVLTGGAGADVFQGTLASLSSDTITDFVIGEKINFVDASLSNFSFSYNGTTLSYTGGSLTLSNHANGKFVATPDAMYGGVDLLLELPPDIFLQNASGQPAVWTMNGISLTGGAGLSNPGNAWHVMARADFNGDGKADFLWQNDSGQPAVWTVNGYTVTGGAALSNPGSSWKVVDAADFNGDGKADILWQNASGQPAIWTMNGLNATSGAAQSNPGPSWHVVAGADFNADGKADILWQNANGQPAVWLADGLNIIGGAGLTNPGSSWHVIGAADFNGDGKADILWQNANGQPAIWTMNGLTVTGGAALTNPGSSWHITGATDFNGDGKADILWQNDNGQPAIWTMNGVTVTGGVGLTNPGNDWHLI